MFNARACALRDSYVSVKVESLSVLNLWSVSEWLHLHPCVGEVRGVGCGV